MPFFLRRARPDNQTSQTSQPVDQPMIRRIRITVEREWTIEVREESCAASTPEGATESWDSGWNSPREHHWDGNEYAPGPIVEGESSDGPSFPASNGIDLSQSVGTLEAFCNGSDISRWTPAEISSSAHAPGAAGDSRRSS